MGYASISLVGEGGGIKRENAKKKEKEHKAVYRAKIKAPWKKNGFQT
jgi:hypothetical protein